MSTRSTLPYLENARSSSDWRVSYSKFPTNIGLISPTKYLNKTAKYLWDTTKSQFSTLNKQETAKTQKKKNNNNNKKSMICGFDFYWICIFHNFFFSPFRVVRHNSKPFFFLAFIFFPFFSWETNTEKRERESTLYVRFGSVQRESETLKRQRESKI